MHRKSQTLFLLAAFECHGRGTGVGTRFLTRGLDVRLVDVSTQAVAGRPVEELSVSVSLEQKR